MTTCTSLCLDGQHQLGCLALIRAARELSTESLPEGVRPGWSWLGELSCEDIPF